MFIRIMLSGLRTVRIPARFILGILIMVLPVVLMGPSGARAADRTWTGSVDNKWNTAGNWEGDNACGTLQLTWTDIRS